MKKYLLASVFGIAAVTSAFANNLSFFQVDVRPGSYYVYGVVYNSETNNNPACYAEVSWKDGSRFQLTRDLADGELFIFIRNNAWNIGDKPGKYNLRANFTKNGTAAGGLNLEYNLVNKNTIVVRNLNKDNFIPLFTNNNHMTFVMPGSIQNAELNLYGTKNVISEISRCIDVARGVDLYPEGTPTNNNSLGRPSTNI
jgi:hypothetical protein